MYYCNFTVLGNLFKFIHGVYKGACLQPNTFVF